ncbi:MAG: DUF3306 domain-containing protein [Variibacter sp.]|nr:DUF3306 domain-containing protein [Variibacter sp.]
MSEGFFSRWSRLKRTGARPTPRRASEPEQTAPPAPSDTAESATDQPAFESNRPSPEAESARRQGQKVASPATAEGERLEPPSAPSLPPIESIGPATDIRPFLQAGVPLEIKRAALRRAWLADPTIRNFKGLAENAWDFTAPEEIPGFAPSLSPEEARRLLAQILRDGTDESEAGEAPVAQVAAADAAAPQRESFSDAADATLAPRDESAGRASNAPRPSGDDASAQENRSDAASSHAATHNETSSRRTAQSSTRRHGGALPQ